MKLVEFSVSNYRSITKAHKIVLHDLTVLVGKNNEGKSNLLGALNVAMNAMIMHADNSDSIRYYRQTNYDWYRDFPIQYQERKQSVESIFKLLFRLEGDELTEFHKLTRLRGNEDIPITIKIGKDNTPKIEVPKKGTQSYNKKSSIITEYISNHISFNYIPAIRTEEMAVDAICDALYGELRFLLRNEEYVSAQEKLYNLEQKMLDNMATQIIEPLKTFIPALSEIIIRRNADDYRLYQSLEGIDILMNDGQLTSIKNKGDGIKSLTTLAILKERSNHIGASIIAIEEPESHLHPGAIHGLAEVIRRISDNNQVIITTHNPLFVQQNSLNSNVLVDKGNARQAKNINEIRNILGILPSDNLQGARFVLLVEGEDDKLSLFNILSQKSEKIRAALQSNQLIIKPLLGASNLSHDAQDLRSSLCRFFVLLDYDKAGKEAFKKAKENGIVSESDVKFTICKGMTESEFEDCIKPDVYRQQLIDEYSVDIKHKSFRGNEKWSLRMKNAFFTQGCEWNDTVERNVKVIVAKAVNSSKDTLDNILITEKAGFIDGLSVAIDNLLSVSE